MMLDVRGLVMGGLFDNEEILRYQQYWSDRISGLNMHNYMGLEMMPAQRLSICDVNAEPLLRIATIEIEQLADNDDLSVGVKTKPYNDINFAPPIYKKVEYCQNSNDVFLVESYCAADDIECHAWDVLFLGGLHLLEFSTSHIVNGSKKFVKVSHRIKYAIADKKVPYMQLICKAHRCKYLDSWFTEGDIITLFVKHDTLPSILSIQPKYEQTYIPMVPKQKLHIFINSSVSNLEWCLGADSALLYHGCEDIDFANIRRYCFECIQCPKTQELIYVNCANDQLKTICVPVIHNNYPLIIDPVRTCIIYANSIDGFILRSYRHMPLDIEGDCVQAFESVFLDYSEIKVEMIKPRPYFVLKRANNQWIVSSTT